MVSTKHFSSPKMLTKLAPKTLNVLTLSFKYTFSDSSKRLQNYSRTNPCLYESMQVEFGRDFAAIYPVADLLLIPHSCRKALPNIPYINQQHILSAEHLPVSKAVYSLFVFQYLNTNNGDNPLRKCERMTRSSC